MNKKIKFESLDEKTLIDEFQQAAGDKIIVGFRSLGKKHVILHENQLFTGLSSSDRYDKSRSL